jgi:hypothetical protein
VKTGDWETDDRGALARDEENVIRLPRDWLGPPEELVPIGPAARARAAQRELNGHTPPTADAFWSEDSAALHDALQAPPEPSPQPPDPPVGLVPPVVGRRRPTLSRLPRLGVGGGGTRASRWWGVAAVPIVALLVAAVIGATESPVSHPAAAHVSASGTPATSPRSVGAPGDAARVASTSKAASVAGARGRGIRRTPTRQHAPVRNHARTRTRSTTRPAKTRHPVTAAHHSTGSPARTVTEAVASPSPTRSSPPPSPVPTSAGSTVSASSNASAASAGGARGSQPATGPAGPTSLGSVTGGCNPKCSS